MESPRPRILLIDDEPVILKLAETLLRRAGYSVRSAPSGEEGLEILLKAEPPFDCVITDAVMPALTGYDVVRFIRKSPRLAALPVLMLTRKRQEKDVKDALAAGVTDYLVKPIDEHLLVDKVELCLSKGQGKRQVFECPVLGTAAESTLELKARITALSESGLTARVSVPLDPLSLGAGFALRSPLFSEVGIPFPHLKLHHCEQLDTSDELPYELKLAFVGLPETSLQKIRAWIRRQESLQRK